MKALCLLVEAGLSYTFGKTVHIYGRKEQFVEVRVSLRNAQSISAALMGRLLDLVPENKPATFGVDGNVFTMYVPSNSITCRTDFFDFESAREMLRALGIEHTKTDDGYVLKEASSVLLEFFQQVEAFKGVKHTPAGILFEFYKNFESPPRPEEEYPISE